MERLDCVLEITNWIKRFHGKVVRINTNGQGNLLNPSRNTVMEFKEAGVDKISISLNAHNKETYNKICRPKFKNAYESVLRFVNDARKQIYTEVTAVTINEVNFIKLVELTKALNVRLRRRDYISY